MEFQFEIKEILPDEITIIESKDSNSVLQIYGLKTLDNEYEGKDWIFNSSYNIWDAVLQKKKEHLETVIDQMGLASSKAQELVMPITTLKKLLNSHQQKLYIIRDIQEPFSVIGILKIGQKRLFICNDINAQHEVDATCVLDFYVHESRQRCGYGYKLFELMLQNEKVEPAKLAIDRPSFKFLAFLSKHYNLKDPKPQPNNFVVYAGFLNRTDLKPPIFLYGKKDLPGQSFSKLKNTENQNIGKSLNSIQAASPFSSNDWKSPSIEKCHHRNEPSSTLDNYFTKKRAYSLKKKRPPALNQHEKNWSVYDAMHSYSGNKNSSISDPNSRSSDCDSLTPVDNMNMCGEKKWTQHQSSWNIFGVKPLDYSITDKKNLTH